MNRENLQRMADYIRTIPQDFFSMYTWRSGDMSLPECDSIGCVIGHCTILDARNIKEYQSYIHKNISFAAWSEYFTRLIPVDREWNWCFSGKWVSIDNTPTGAADRIEWLLKNGVPENWEDQILGNAPLCYKK